MNEGSCMKDKTIIQNGSKYQYSFEVLRIICSIAVVSIHTVYQSHLLFQDPSDNRYLFLYNFLAFAVPIFVMITGAIWLNPEKDFNLKKSLLRVVIPLFSFGIVFSILERYYVERVISWKLLLSGIVDVFLGNSWDIFWYIYMLIGLYLLMPLFRAATKVMQKKQIAFLILVLFIFCSLMPELETIFSFSLPVTIPVNSVYVMYIFLGYYLSKYRISLADSVLIILCGILFVSLYTIFCGKTAYLMVQTVVYSTGIFTFFISFEKKFESLSVRVKSFLIIISKTTFGVYIIHMIFTNVIYKVFKYNPYNHNLLLSWLAIAAICWTLSVVSTYIIQRIPVVNKIWKV